MLDAFTHLNWLAIGAATIAYYLLGALWFSPLFGAAWDSAIGFHRPRGHRFGLIYYVTPLVSALLVTVATAVLAYALDLEHLTDALLLGGVVGFGYAATVSVNNAITPHTPRPLLLGAVTGSYHVVGIVIVSVIIVWLT